jgi:polyphosphate glucokinase
MPRLNLNAPIVPAHLRNRAGIIGAAWLAVDRAEHPERPA